jgi:hypothetical protein
MPKYLISHYLLAEFQTEVVAKNKQEAEDKFYKDDNSINHRNHGDPVAYHDQDQSEDEIEEIKEEDDD